MNFPLDVGRAGLRLAMFVIVLGGALLLITRPSMDSPGFVVTVLMLGFAGFCIAVLMALMYLTNRADSSAVSEGANESDYGERHVLD